MAGRVQDGVIDGRLETSAPGEILRSSPSTIGALLADRLESEGGKTSQDRALSAMPVFMLFYRVMDDESFSKFAAQAALKIH